MSIGAKTILGMASNKKPLPNRYKCPLSKSISPIYIAGVTQEATKDGIRIEKILLLPSRNEPIYIPIVIPNITKNKHIRKADNGETVISPVLKKAVKQAIIQSPRNAPEETD